MAVTLKVANLDEVVSKLRAQVPVNAKIRIGIIVRGPAAAYALVWEWGRVDINPGPKTRWSTNADGARVVLTIQAPHGYVRVNRDRYIQFVKDAFYRVDWRRVSLIKPKSVERAVRRVMKDAGERCKQLIWQTAPVDTGDLMEAIELDETGSSLGEIEDVVAIHGVPLAL